MTETVEGTCIACDTTCETFLGVGIADVNDVLPWAADWGLSVKLLLDCVGGRDPRAEVSASGIWFRICRRCEPRAEPSTLAETGGPSE